jgi:hypothetical protein
VTDLLGLLESEAADIRQVEALLDALDDDARTKAVRALGRRHMARLFDLAEGHRTLRVGGLVPEDAPPFEGVVHHGKNSLWAFRLFAKVMCRPDDPEARARGELWGYNLTSGFVTTTVGPGFFVAYDHGEREVLVDYLRLPTGKPETWPAMLPNDARLSRFVYNGTQDVLRGVSSHVSIGRASRRGRDINAWFVLCREDAKHAPPPIPE